MLTLLDEFEDKKQKKWGLPTFRLVLVKCGKSITRVTPAGNWYSPNFFWVNINLGNRSLGIPHEGAKRRGAALTPGLNAYLFNLRNL